MALFSLSSLITAATRDEIKTEIYTILATLGVNTTAWEAGAVTRTMITALAALIAAYSDLQVSIVKSGFLDLAEGSWLTLVAKYVYGETRIDATYATGTVTLTNSGGGYYELDPGDLVVSSSTSGKSYRSTEALVLSGGTAVDIGVVALEAGTESNAASGEIDTLVTTLLGVTVTNDLSLAGLDAEKDPALRARCREKLGALSPLGPWDAYSYAARNAKLSTGESAGVTKVRVLKDGYGNVTVLVASAAGAVTAEPLAAVDDAVQLAAAPLAVNASIASASALAVLVQYETWVYNTSGYTTTEIKAFIADSLATLFAELRIGGALLDPEDATGHVYRDAIRAAISKTLPEIYHVVLYAPISDPAVTNTQVASLVHDPSGSDAIVNQVAPPEGSV